MRYHTKQSDTTDFISSRVLHVNAAGEQAFAQFDYTVHRKGGRRDFHILYITHGACTAVYGDNCKILRAGGFLLYPPSVTQKYTFYAKDRTQSLWVHFSGRGAEELLCETGLVGGIYETEADSGITAAFRDMIEEKQFSEHCTDDPFACVKQSAKLLALLVLLAQKVHGGQKHSEFEGVLRAMRADIGKNYSASRYAALCSLSESRFSHKFKQEIGVSPSEYFIGLKMARAEELLRSTNLRVYEIAAMMGFENSLYFSRLFKRYRGESPLLYKKLHERKG